jgi:hypothetical protein
MAAAEFNAWLASLVVLQQHQQQQQQQASQPLGLGNGEVVKGFHESGRGGLVTPLSLQSFSTDSNRPRQRKKRSSSSRARGREVEFERRVC